MTRTLAALAIMVAALVMGGEARAQAPGVACNKSAIYDAATNGSTQLVAAVAGKSIFVCGYVLYAGGTANVKLIAGTGVACVTNSVNLTPAFTLVTQTGVTDPSPIFRGMATPVSNALCINTSAGVAVQAVVYYNQP